MNLLVPYKSLDIAAQYMLEELSARKDINVYIAIAGEEDQTKVRGRCIAVQIPPIKSKYSRSAIKALRNIIETYQIDIALAISTSALSNLIFACRGNRKVKIVGYRGTQARVKRLDPTYRMALLNPRVDHIVCATRDIEEYLRKFIDPSKLSVNPKPFDVKWVEQACSEPKQAEGIPEDAFKVINISTSKGRPFKGLSYLIKAVISLDDPTIHLIHIGDHDIQDLKLAQQSSAAGRIHLIGRREDAIHYLPLQDLFVLPSLRDAWARVVREAMACSLPCIVTDIPGSRDMVVDGETGLLVSPGSVEELAEAISRLKSDPALCERFGIAARQRVIEEFSPAVYADNYEKLFRSLI